MYLASLINKGREVYANGTTDPTALPAETVLKMATVNGAKSVLWDDEIGSLEVGKKVELWLPFSFYFISHVNFYPPLLLYKTHRKKNKNKRNKVINYTSERYLKWQITFKVEVML